MRILFNLFLAAILSGCAISQKTGLVEYRPEPAPNKMQKEFDSIPAPAGKKIAVAVYSFQDKTGQRRPQANIASLSMAVTQGAEVFLIKALQDVGQGQWFDVVERVGIDALTKERTIIRQMREAYEGKDAKPLMPLMFAGIIFEGGIIGYDSSTESGGAAYRFLGIGPSTQYSKDTVTISLRAVSVNTGKVLAAVTVTKIVYSTNDSVAVLKYLDNKNLASQIFGNAGNTNSVTGSMFEFETGLTINEPGTLAVKATIEAAVVELIKEGQRKGVWEFRKPEPPRAQAVPAPVALPVAPPVAVAQPVAEPTVVAKTDARETAKNPTNPVAVVRGPPPQPVVAPVPETPKPVVNLERRPGESMADSIRRLQTETAATDSTRYLSELTYLHAEADEKTTKRWQLPRGTKLTAKALPNDWYFVEDQKGHKGHVKGSSLVTSPPEVKK